MRRTSLAVAAVAVAGLATAGVVALAGTSGEERKSPNADKDASHELNRTQMKKQVAAQAKQTQDAMRDLAEKTAKESARLKAERK